LVGKMDKNRLDKIKIIGKNKLKALKESGNG
jgi:hypothetical protein